MRDERLVKFDKDIMRVVGETVKRASPYIMGRMVTQSLFDELNPMMASSGSWFSVDYNPHRGELRVQADLTSEREDDRVLHIYDVKQGRALIKSIQDLSVSIGQITDTGS